ncbi:MAG: bifunctional diaminohydroxyphosphoribosylaminopyrimidine deaminase/5-amino-6-(5-phosphoribosylamino)uracil reductase RibD [Deltaproteobacteria bacterium]|nr:bifunctional diaminohydroxyphosphoribosylaminopyrimidine deaminase/5-amino-6-(5-phosphoribosylamino)uracil reductase RibD [Deltaproteobacteria bacterium]
MNKDTYWMRRALAISQRGLGHVNPNPMVGAIVVDKDGQKIAQGFHAKYGMAHAEATALEYAGKRAQGATLYVTLEPCSHHGKTPPCAQTVIDAGIQKVVIGSLDPNPKVSSVAMLQAQGIEVVTGILAKDIARFNRGFFARVQGQSYVLAKVALSRDGYMGHKTQRLSISGPQVGRHTMKLRALVDGILVGRRTWQNDDPSLNVRGPYASYQPAAILLDPQLEIGKSAKVFTRQGRKVVLIYDPERAKPSSWMLELGVCCLPVAPKDKGFAPKDILAALRAQGIYSILLEGGGQTLASFSRQHCIDDWVIYHSPDRLKGHYPEDQLVSMPEMPFSPDLQSVIRCGRDWVWTTLHCRG